MSGDQHLVDYYEDEDPEQYRQDAARRRTLQDGRVAEIRSRGGLILDLEFLARLARDPEHLRAESPIEQLMSAAIRRLSWDIPLKAQVPIGPYRVDFLLGDKHVLECDGAAFHTGKRQRARDAERDEWLRGHGYVVHRLTGAEIRRDEDACARGVVSAAGLL